MVEPFVEFQTKFRIDELTILRTKYWTWSVRPVPCTLGAGIISLNRFCKSFAEVNDEEHVDLGNLIRKIESKLTTTFTPDKYNYLMLMMVDEHVHFHALPRYSSTQLFNSLEWIDSGWPKLPNLGDYSDRSDSLTLRQIRSILEKV